MAQNRAREMSEELDFRITVKLRKQKIIDLLVGLVPGEMKLIVLVSPNTGKTYDIQLTRT